MGNTTKAREVMLSKVSKYEEPYQYYLLNQNKGESIRAIARKFNIDHNGFSRFIKKQESPQDSPRINNAIEGIKSGLEVIKDLQESPLKRDNQLAQKAIATLEDYYPQMRSIFVSIQNRVLNALDRETQTMEAMGELTIDNIAKVQSVLKSANDTNAFIPKTPLVAVQNNIQNNNSNNNQNLQVNQSGGKGEVELPPLKVITIKTKEDLEKAKQYVDCEIVE